MVAKTASPKRSETLVSCDHHHQHHHYCYSYQSDSYCCDEVTYHRHHYHYQHFDYCSSSFVWAAVVAAVAAVVSY